MIQEMSFDELRTDLSNCKTKMLMFLIMMANEILMDRCDKGTLESEICE